MRILALFVVLMFCGCRKAVVNPCVSCTKVLEHYIGGQLIGVEIKSHEDYCNGEADTMKTGVIREYLLQGEEKYLVILNCEPI